MTKNFSILPLIFCGVWGAAQAMAATSACGAIPNNIVANCGFESGNFTSWTITGNTTNPGNNYYGVDAFDAHSGNDGAYMSQDFSDSTPTSPVILSQTLTTIVGATYDITFWLKQNSPTPDAAYVDAFTAMWGATTMESLTYNVSTPGTTAYTEYSFVETATSTSTILSFSFRDDQSAWSFDDVSVNTPEPSTGLLAGIALCALTGLLAGKRRKRRI